MTNSFDLVVTTAGLSLIVVTADSFHSLNAKMACYVHTLPPQMIVSATSFLSLLSCFLLPGIILTMKGFLPDNYKYHRCHSY